ncbi:unnamed protein product [Prunus armeniaca]
MPIRPTKRHRDGQRQAIRLLTVSASLLTVSASSLHLRHIRNPMGKYNKIIKKTLRKKLGAAKGNWPAILPEALWAINTSYRRSTSEAVVPVEVHAPTCRTTSYDP